MTHYELLYLVAGSVPEQQIEGITARVSGWITELGGSLTKQEAWGRRKLAYPINNEKQGFYVVSEFDAEGAASVEMRKRLQLDQEILRFMLITKKPLSAKDLLRQESAHKRAQRSATADQPQEREARAPKEDESKIKLEELDTKLDELLDQDMSK